MNENKTNLLSLSREELRELLISLGEKPFRADQLFGWIYAKGCGDFQAMSNLNQPLRDKLEKEFKIGEFQLKETTASANRNTQKFLFSLNDQNAIETVLMSYFEAGEELQRQSLCVSTQVGCAMNCAFCASGKSGLIRNLSRGEIVEQAWQVNRKLIPKGERINNLVFMGVGEPLQNYEAVIKTVAFLNQPETFGIGARHITISTCGIVPQILKLAQEPYQIRLAISLNAASDELRNQLMPINKKYPLKELVGALKTFQEATHRRITIEYIMIKGVNDSAHDAQQLAKLLKGIHCLVNLIPLNPIAEFASSRSLPEKIARFQEILETVGQKAVIRKEMGGRIAAACGQLRYKHLGGEE